MDIESTGNEVVVEAIELDRAEHVGEAGRLNAVRVELGLSGEVESPTGVPGFSGLNGMKESGTSK